MKNLSPKDKEIINILQNDADITNAELAKRIGLSPSAVLGRVKNLKADGTIRRIHAKLNASELGYSLHVFVYIKLLNQGKETLSYLEGAVKMNSRVQDCFRMTGDYDYVLRLLLKDTSELEYFLTHELSRIPLIASIRTEVAMKCIKQDSSIAI
ncbi:MAG: Lrp/AsnC family transcriptional regulator [Gammaproteobacteria bacterium]|jgi:Lrp/AsnC family leucine-responsive transcriptional regulator|nr:Lrp/AsnC family transcriptional regulator [Gammaproteobacteria bacterium]